MKGISTKLPVRIDEYAVYVGGRFSLSFQRTLRVPEVGVNYGAPPRLGNFRVQCVQDYPAKVPTTWADLDGIFIPMYQREALWLAFGGVTWKPNAVLVGEGGVNVITGEPMEAGLSNRPQNYIVSPCQPWLAGASSGGGKVRQFVAPPSDRNFISAFVPLANDEMYSLEVLVYDPKPGAFPGEKPCTRIWSDDMDFEDSFQPYRFGMNTNVDDQQGFAPIPDQYGLDIWEPEPCGRIAVHLVNIQQYCRITDEEPPYTPANVSTYAAADLPWMEDYYEEVG